MNLISSNYFRCWANNLKNLEWSLVETCEKLSIKNMIGTLEVGIQNTLLNTFKGIPICT